MYRTGNVQNQGAASSSQAKSITDEKREIHSLRAFSGFLLSHNPTGLSTVAQRFSAFSGDITRRSLLLSVPSSQASAALLQATSSPNPTGGYRGIEVRVAGQSVPVAVWTGSGTSEGPYPYRISVSKIVKLRLGLGLPWPLARTFALSSADSWQQTQANIKCPPEQKRKSSQLCVILCHGYLGSRFDFAHLAELLASRGILVAAPEFAESSSASFEPIPEKTTRDAIVQATLAYLEQNASSLMGKNVDALRCGIVGHSAGGGTAVRAQGSFPLGRVSVAGGTAYDGPDPLLIIASEGDGLFRRRWPDILANLSPDLARYEGFAGAAQLSDTDKSPARAALLFKEDAGAAAAAPSHISFLSSATNDAMVDFLSPVLPLARLLGVPVFDLDVYQQRPDSDAIAAAVLPAILRFLESQA